MADLIDTTEMYLRTILELEEEEIKPLRARIAERLGHSGPTVSQTVSRMERDGLVVVGDDRTLELTALGRRRAIDVMRKHRLAERLLSDVIGLDWAYVHEEACRWEHVMSQRVEQRLVELLGYPTQSPYGNPIPGLDVLAGEPDIPELDPVISVTRVLTEGAPVVGVVARLGETIQMDPELLHRLRQAGVIPGAAGVFRIKNTTVSVHIDAESQGIDLPSTVAAHIFMARS